MHETLGVKLWQLYSFQPRQLREHTISPQELLRDTGFCYLALVQHYYAVGIDDSPAG